jgi:hypothetical protein
VKRGPRHAAQHVGGIARADLALVEAEDELLEVGAGGIEPLLSVLDAPREGATSAGDA